ncbi:DUF5996 family protein [Arcanobacterium phocae]|uniref:DUF5996 family protein n=1 Tax=Arcanobacterium phocae TaxID=131112 RepID=UPI001C0F25A3|nr:DUF5996 family protein [Arcanobacterium phocae]
MEKNIMASSLTLSSWPELRIDDWEDTRDTLHMWTQIIGKIRMQYAPLVNHWWQVTLYVSPVGLTTSSIPFHGDVFDIEFDFISHEIRFRRSNGLQAKFVLEPMTVADFYTKVQQSMADIDVPMDISVIPNEVDPAIPFPEDTVHKSYDKDAVHRFWLQLSKVHIALDSFRAGFLGKVSPVHFFWGSFDMACTRFVDEPAPQHPGGVPNCADWVMVEGYSHHLTSAGFWPGGEGEGMFYSYAYPAPDGYARQKIEPAEAYYSEDLHEYVLPYEAVRKSDNPDEMVRQFLESTYALAADLDGWDREKLDADPDRLATYMNE